MMYLCKVDQLAKLMRHSYVLPIIYLFYLSLPPCSCSLELFYRHSKTEPKVTFLFPDMLVRSGDKPVTTEKPKVKKPKNKKVTVYSSMYTVQWNVSNPHTLGTEVS